MSNIKALEIIQGANILTKDDWRGLTDIKDELKHAWETVQIFRTKTEMICSVLDDVHFPTPDAKYWQSVREQNVHFCELVNLSYEYRKKSVELRKLQKALTSETDELEIKLKGIEIEQTEWHMRQMERIAHDRIREVLEWSNIKKELLPKLKYGIDDVNAHQLESYHKQFNNEANNMTDFTPPADRANLAGKAVTINRITQNGKVFTSKFKEVN